MQELNEQVAEEVTEQNDAQSLEQEVENVIDETKFDSAGDDSVMKIDLSQPPPVNEEVVEKKRKYRTRGCRRRTTCNGRSN